MGLGMPIPDLSNKPGPGRPGWGPTGSYDFQFEVATGQVGITVLPRVNGSRFTIKWQDGTEQAITSAQTNLQSPTTQAGIISINNEELDTTWCDDFAVASGKQFVTKVISWGQNPWNRLSNAFKDCTNLTDISTTSLIADTGANIVKIFSGCTSLLEADIRNWDLTAGVSWYGGSPFSGLVNLQKLDMTGLVIKLTARSDNAFSSIGSATTDGCEFLMSNIDWSTSTAAGTYTVYWFTSVKFKNTSNLSGWNFPSSGWAGTGMFNSAKVIGTDAVLNISNWTTYSGALFPSFSSFNNGLGNTGAKIDLTNFGMSNVSSMSNSFYFTDISKIIGLSTWGATAGSVNMFRTFWGSDHLSFSDDDNFSNTFIQSLTPTRIDQAFMSVGVSSPNGVAPNISNIDLSGCTTTSQAFSSARFTNVPDLASATFSSTSTIDMRQTFSGIRISDADAHVDFSNTAVKISNATQMFSGAHIDKVTFGNNVDFSSLTTVANMFYYPGTPIEVKFPTNADFSSLSNAGNWFAGLVGPTTGPLTTCQVDNLIRRFRATAYGNALNVNFYGSQITEAPSVVNAQEAELVANGWSISENATDATLPFAYASYAVDPTGITTISPTTTPPVGSVFTATNGLTISNSGVITIDTFRGGSTIRCTYPDGCYNEVVMLIQVPFQVDVTINSSTSYVWGFNPQMSAGECLVDWGDSSSETVTGNITHTYANTGGDATYSVKIFDAPSGSKFTGFNAWNNTYINNGGNLIDIKKWGDIQWQNNTWFSNDLNISPYYLQLQVSCASNDAPDLSQVTSLNSMFRVGNNRFNYAFTDPNNSLASWNVSTITDMAYMFAGIGKNGSVTDNGNFDTNLNSWDVSSVTDMSSLAALTRGSSQNRVDFFCDQWDVSKVESFNSAFYSASGGTVVNRDLSNWNTSSATDMAQMFYNNTPGPNTNLLYKVVNAGQASEYKAWDVSNVTSFTSMFYGGKLGTQGIYNWKINSTAGVNVNMASMFQTCPDLDAFVQTDADHINTKQETVGSETYTAWNMSRVSSLSNFNYNGYTTPYNPDLSGWSLGNVTTMSGMFYDSNPSIANPVLNRDISNWKPISVANMTNFYRNDQKSPIAMDRSNYDILLDIANGWGSVASSMQSGVAFDMGTSQYTATNVVQGTCNSTGTNNTNCNDYANSPFVTAGVQVGDIAYNVTTGQYSKVLSIVFTGTGITTDQAIWSDGDIYRVERSDAVKGRYALIEAGWTITDGGLYVPPITPLKFNVNVTTSTTDANLNFKIPFITGTNFSINWGDGNTDTGLSSGNAAVTHTYSTAGTYSIEVGQAGDAGPPTKIAFGPSNGEPNNFSTPGNGAKAVTEITQWGSIQWTDVVSMWCGCLNLDTISATDTPDLSNVGGTDGTKFMFGAMRLRDGFDAPSLSTVNSSINNWDVSSIRNFSFTFKRCNSFNANINNWDISGIDQSTGLTSMFSGARLFNQPLNNWTLPSAVTSLSSMFSAHDTTNGFNQDIGSWNVSNITNMSSMFSSNAAFTGINLENWERTTAGNVSTVGNVTNMAQMFWYGYGLANTAISNWDTSSVTNFYGMFGRWGFPTGSNPQIDVGNIVKYWDTSSATNMFYFFSENRAINQNVGSINISSLTNGGGMFYRSDLMSTANYTDTIVGFAQFVKNQTPDAPLNVNFTGQNNQTYDTTRTATGFTPATAGRARSFLTLDVTVSGGSSAVNGVYYYDYANDKWVSEADANATIEWNSDESSWDLSYEGSVEHAGSGGTEAGGPESSTSWSGGLTVVDSSKGWSITADTITT